MDELLSFAPDFIKVDCEDIFDYKKLYYQVLKLILNEAILFSAKEILWNKRCIK